ncbi:PhoH family protein [Jeotgalibaca ciconiae]|uniref:PhoH-like protein n=1 Tax=Jeotgalibaca ciconiae TaxID=2496265 RepID=A0A3Q9BNA0_9LACT|nr:PhoH family protein [Jeotgalibaca ciconiae]AZP05456.1 phosphate starvation-inducible protein PhoH [Jeotgalibaca ciconiae]
MTENEEYPVTIGINVENAEVLPMLFGSQDKNLQLLEDHLNVVINSRGTHIDIKGSEKNVKTVESLVLQLIELIKKDIQISQSDIVTAIKMAERGSTDFFSNLYDEVIGKTYTGKSIRAKNVGQKKYYEAVQKKDVVFGIGPAGTGKTFLAVVMAVQALKAGRVQKIILTRPAVEAGENLGFLPGDLKEKVDPYLRPVYDALYTIYGVEHTTRLMERGVIEIAPLAYMRGRTLEEAFVILDEAQNTTVAQMKMFLTRLGFGSKMIVNGDKTQIDLPKGSHSGLIDAENKLKGISDISFVSFDAHDVVRHPVVARIIEAYEEKGTTKND